MPRAKNISGADRFNFLLALVGYLIEHPMVEVSTVAKHFGLTEPEVVSAVGTLSVSGAIDSMANDLFDFNFDLLEEEGIIQMTFCPIFDSSPRISQRQGAAMAAGLQYLKNLELLTDTAEIDELVNFLVNGTSAEAVPVIEINAKPGSVHADFLTLRAAVAAQIVVEFEYQAANGVTRQRKVEPRRLIAKDDNWLLQAWASDDPIESRMIKNFRLDRMRSVKLTDFAISDEGLQAELPDQIYTANATDTEVLIQVSPEGEGFINYFEAEVVDEDKKNKTKTVRVRIGNLATLGRTVCRYGGAIRVLEPKLARDAVRDYALRALGESGLSSSNLDEE